ncbi:hypothetical protein HG531_004956 [Fusarium graminearum]|nr:hypothetical protein HG531_004956 [Fusarium graminearum]
MVLQLNSLNSDTLVIHRGQREASLLEILDVVGVDLIAMSVTLLHHINSSVQASELAPLGAGLEHASPTPVVIDLLLGTLRHEDDNAVLSGGRKLFRGGALETHDVAGILNDCSLHTQADTKVGQLALTSPLGNINHTLNTSGTKATRNNDTLGANNVCPSFVELAGVLLLHLGLEVLRVDRNEVQFSVASHSGVLEGLVDTEVSVGDDSLLPEIPESLTLLSHRRGDLALIQSQTLLQELEETLLFE